MQEHVLSLVTQCIMISGIFITGNTPAHSLIAFKIWLTTIISGCGGGDGRFLSSGTFAPDNVLLYHHLTPVSCYFAFY